MKVMNTDTKPVDVLTQSAPPRVWLQVDTDGDPNDRSEPIDRSCWYEMTWNFEPIGGLEVEYIRADAVAELIDRDKTATMTRRQLRNRYPFHGLPPPISQGPVTRYDRHTLRHRWRAFWARIRRHLPF